MRIAAIYDIHGNLPALEAVLNAIRDSGADQIVVGGDVVPGPMPRETLDCLRSIEIPMQFIAGNGEVAVLAEMEGKNSGVPEAFRSGVQWNAEQLGGEERDWLTAWPRTVRINVPDLGDVLFCHATPRNENEIFTEHTPEEAVLRAFTGVDVALVVCGHTHMQFDRRAGNLRIVNAGSVGMPFGEPGAYWLALGPAVELRRTVYDFNAAAERIRQTNYPQAEEFAANNVLRSPPREQMLAAFAKAELR